MHDFCDFLSNTKARDDECLIWTGVKVRNYGKYRYRAAHRISYALFVGELIPDLVIDHLCNNKMCVNPWHLQQTTKIENWHRGRDLYNDSVTQCPNGHEYTEENTGYSNGYRCCKECRRNRNREYYLKH